MQADGAAPSFREQRPAPSGEPWRAPASNAWHRITDRRSYPVIAAIAAATAAAAGLAFAPTHYHATARIVVTPLQSKDPNFAGLPVLRSSGDPTASLTTARDMIAAAPVAALAASQMGPRWTEQRAAADVSVTLESNSSFVDVSATASTSALASRLANVYASAAVNLRGREIQPAIVAALREAAAELRALGPAGTPAGTAAAARVTALQGLVGHGDPTIQLAVPAQVTEQVEATRDALIVLLALGSGALLGLYARWFARRVDRRPITTLRRLSELTGLPILARLPAATLRSPVGVPSMGASREVEGALTLLGLQGGRVRTIAFVSPTPHDGKTSAAIAFATHAARSESSVALLDIDWRKRDASRRLGVRGGGLPGQSSSDYLLPTPTAALLVGGCEPRPDAGHLREQIAHASSLVDLVIVDTPAMSLAPDAVAAATAAEAVLLVVRLDHTPEQALARALDALLTTGGRPVGVVVLERPGWSRPRPGRLRTRAPVGLA